MFTGGINIDEDGPINSYQSLPHEEADQKAMKRLIDALCLKEGSCDCDTLKKQRAEDWQAPSEADDEFNPMSMDAIGQGILLDMETNPTKSNDHEEAIANLGKHITSLQYGSTVYRVINDNDPGRSRFRNVKPQCGECRLEFGRRNCFVRHIINRQNRWSSTGYRLISSYRSLQPADFAAFTAGDGSNYWCRDFKELEQKWRSLMKEHECAELDTVKIVDYQSLRCYLIKMIDIMTKSNNGGGQSCYSKKSLLYRVGDESHHLRIEFTNK